jgi:hypothetical protein
MAEKEVRLIDVRQLYQCKTCRYHKRCDFITTCDHGEMYSPDMSKLETIDPESLRPQWVSVEEKLPVDKGWVLCACRAGIIEVLKYDKVMDDWDTTMPNRCYMKGFVTHWMPLPEPPISGAKMDGDR